MTARPACALLLCVLPCIAAASETPANLPRPASRGEAATANESRGESLRQLIASGFRSAARKRPEWVQDKPEVDLHADEQSLGDETWRLVLQQERRDGAELLTLRRPLRSGGPVHAYAGAGLNRVVYYAEDDYGFTRFWRRSRHRSLGAAAEIGAELNLGRHLRLGADLRWAEMDERAVALQSEGVLVAADPLVAGLSLGWRF